VLETLIRTGARQVLQAALEAEIQEHLERYKTFVDENGNRQIVRKGHQAERTVLTAAGPIPVRRPRVDDRVLEGKGEQRFSSQILPKFMSRAASLDSLIPALYLQGISMDDFPTALVPSVTLSDPGPSLLMTHFYRFISSTLLESYVSIVGERG
jgi:transposase-like protein